MCVCTQTVCKVPCILYGSYHPICVMGLSASQHLQGLTGPAKPLAAAFRSLVGSSPVPAALIISVSPELAQFSRNRSPAPLGGAGDITGIPPTEPKPPVLREIHAVQMQQQTNIEKRQQEESQLVLPRKQVPSSTVSFIHFTDILPEIKSLLYTFNTFSS